LSANTISQPTESGNNLNPPPAKKEQNKQGGGQNKSGNPQKKQSESSSAKPAGESVDIEKLLSKYTSRFGDVEKEIKVFRETYNNAMQAGTSINAGVDNFKKEVAGLLGELKQAREGVANSVVEYKDFVTALAVEFKELKAATVKQNNDIKASLDNQLKAASNRQWAAVAIMAAMLCVMMWIWWDLVGGMAALQSKSEKAVITRTELLPKPVQPVQEKK
jgi:hypothetical protein